MGFILLNLLEVQPESVREIIKGNIILHFYNYILTKNKRCLTTEPILRSTKTINWSSKLSMMPPPRPNKPSTDSVLTIILALRDSLVRSNQSYLVSQMKERLNTISDSIISKGTAISKSLNGSLSSPSCSRIKWNPSTVNLKVTNQSTGMMLKPQVQQPKNVNIE